MAIVTGLTAARMLEIENASVVNGYVNEVGRLTLVTKGGEQKDAGPVVGPPGAIGDFVNVRDHGAVGDGVTDDTNAIQTAISETPDGGLLYFADGEDAYNVTGTLTINKRMIITGPGIIRYNSVIGAPLFKATSSDVTFTGLNLTGPGITSVTDRVLNNRAIWAVGTLANPLSNIRITDCSISGFIDSGIWLDYVNQSHIIGNTVSDMLYAGIMGITLTNSEISANIVENIVQKGTVVNTYGIAVTDVDNTLAARSANVAINGNIVSYVRDWEGIDTHSGINISITGNVVTGCYDGISCVAGSASRLVAPENVTVSGNTVDSTGANNPRAAIRLFGVNTTTRCSGIVLANTIRGSYSVGRLDLGFFDLNNTQFDRFVGFTPTWTGITLGNAVQSCRYTRVGTTITAIISLTLGSTSAVTGLFDFTVPIDFSNNAVTYQALGAATLIDTSSGGAGRYPATALILSVGSNRVMFVANAGQATNTVPFTWADGDKITCQIVYEAVS